MSQDSAAERTEEATPKRLQEARQKGEVARSKELDTAFSLAAGAAGLAVLGPSAAQRMREALAELWTIDRAEATDPGRLVPIFLDAVVDAVLLLSPFMALMFASSFLGPALMGGFLFATPRFDPKRLDPMKGIGRMISTQALGELVKAIAKVMLFGAAVWTVAPVRAPGAGRARPRAAGARDGRGLRHRVLADPRARRGHGPDRCGRHALAEVPARQEAPHDARGGQARAARDRGVSGDQVPPAGRAGAGLARADDPGGARGERDHHEPDALRGGAQVRGRGPGAPPPPPPRWSWPRASTSSRSGSARSRSSRGVRTFEAPPLARALFRHVRVGEPVRPELWHAVAQVLAFVIRLDAAVARGRGAGPRTPWPVPPGPSELEVPPELGDGVP